MKIDLDPHILERELLSRKRLNPRYSLRAFARDLRVSPSTLSRVVRGERELPRKIRVGIAKSLGLSPSETTAFICCELQEKSHACVIAEWEYYTVLSLLKTRGFKSNAEFVAQRLGVPLVRAQEVVKNLLALELIREKDGRWFRTSGSIRTSDDRSSRILRQAHAESLVKARESLQEVPPELRDFYSATYAIRLSDLPRIKKIIRSFEKRLSRLLGKGLEGEEVYQLGVQFFPLTRLYNKE